MAAVSPALAGEGPDTTPAREHLPLGVPQRANTPEAANPKGTTPATLAGSSLQVAIALAIVVGLIVGAGFVIRKVAARGGGLLGAIGPGGRAPAGVIEVLGRFPLARGMTLVLLKLDRRVLLVSMGLGRGGGNMNTLCEITDPDEVASLLLRTRDEAGESIARQFAGLLQREDGRAEDALKPVTVGAGGVSPRAAARPSGVPPASMRAKGPAKPARPSFEVRA